MMLTPRCQYSHSLGSHLRFTIQASKGNLHLAREIQAQLRGVEGVLLVSANYRTGNVLILCEKQGVDREQLAARLRAFDQPSEAQSQCTNQAERHCSPSL